MDAKTSRRRRAVVLGVQDTPAGWQALQEAVDVALRAQAALHLVAAYELQDTCRHRRDRVAGPAEVAYLTSPRADAEALLREAAARVAGRGVECVGHVHHGTLRGGLRRVTQQLATAPVPAAPQPLPGREPAWQRLSSLRFRRRQGGVAAEAVALAAALTEPAAVAAASRPGVPSPRG